MVHGVVLCGRVALPLALAGLGLLAVRPRIYVYPARVTCMTNLVEMGGLLAAGDALGSLEQRPGSAWVLQVRSEIAKDQWHVFHWPGDPARSQDSPCSYRGPDEWLLRKPQSKEHGILFVACDADGPNGDEPFHRDGVCVLTDRGSAEFIRCKDMQGYSGGPVRVGPGSPDPRFRHLVR